jgi:hypothetical protein
VIYTFYLYCLADAVFSGQHGIECGERIPWKNLLTILLKHKLALHNWPRNITAPGPDFDIKRISPTDLAKLVRPYLKQQLGFSYDADDEAGRKGKDEDEDEDEDEDTDFKPLLMVKWSIGKFFRLILSMSPIFLLSELQRRDLDDPQMASTPLVVDQRGSSIYALCDCDEWLKRADKASKETRPSHKRGRGSRIPSATTTITPATRATAPSAAAVANPLAILSPEQRAFVDSVGAATGTTGHDAVRAAIALVEEDVTRQAKADFLQKVASARTPSVAASSGLPPVLAAGVPPGVEGAYNRAIRPLPSRTSTVLSSSVNPRPRKRVRGDDGDDAADSENSGAVRSSRRDVEYNTVSVLCTVNIYTNWLFYLMQHQGPAAPTYPHRQQHPSNWGGQDRARSTTREPDTRRYHQSNARAGPSRSSDMPVYRPSPLYYDEVLEEDELEDDYHYRY